MSHCGLGSFQLGQHHPVPRDERFKPVCDDVARVEHVEQLPHGGEHVVRPRLDGRDVALAQREKHAQRRPNRKVRVHGKGQPRLGETRGHARVAIGHVSRPDLRRSARQGCAKPTRSKCGRSSGDSANGRRLCARNNSHERVSRRPSTGALASRTVLLQLGRLDSLELRFEVAQLLLELRGIQPRRPGRIARAS